MAYYDALIAKWATLTPGTTAAKLAQLNAITVSGSVPTSMVATGDQIANCIDWAEFNALTPARQTNILQLCAIPGKLLGGSANLSHLLPGMIVAYFPGGGPTIVALTALAQALAQPWWQASVANGGGGLQGPVTATDLIPAGGLS